MNRQELESKLDIVNSQLEYWQETKALLEAEFAEAEKPGLGHGDYGKATVIQESVFWFYADEGIFPFKVHGLRRGEHNVLCQGGDI